MSTEVAALYPVGIGDINRMRQNHPEKHTVFCRPVSNEVMVVNPDIQSPFNLQVGKSTPVALFAHSVIETDPWVKEIETISSQMEGILGDIDPYEEEMQQQTVPLEFWPMHHRSLILARAIISDNKQRYYRDIDLKGSGFVIPDSGNKEVFLRSYHQPVVNIPGRQRGDTKDKWGLLAEQDALNDYFMTEQFLGAGIRTHRVISIIKLHELISGGRNFSVYQLVDNEDYSPVLALRAFGTKARIDDLFTDIDSHLLAQDALSLVAQEQGSDHPLSADDYLDWFATTLGQNVGLMHKNNWGHHYLTPHNISLDCRIVDLDTVTRDPSSELIYEDKAQAKDSLFRLAGFFSNWPDYTKLWGSYLKSYYDAYSRPNLVSKVN